MMFKTMIHGVASAAIALGMGFAGTAHAEPGAMARASGELKYVISKITATRAAPSVTWLTGAVPTGTGFVQYANLEQTQNAKDPVGGYAGSTSPVTAGVEVLSTQMVNQVGFGLVQANSTAFVVPGSSAATGTLAQLSAVATGAYGTSGAVGGQRVTYSDVRYARAFTLGPNTRITFTLTAGSSAVLNNYQWTMNGRQQFWTAMTDTYLYAGAKQAAGYYRQDTNSYMYTLQERYYGASQGYAAGDGVQREGRDMRVTFDNATTGLKSGAVWAITQAKTNMTQ